MEYLVLRDGRFRETKEEDFAAALQSLGAPLLFVDEGENIDIVADDDKEEYDFHDILATIVFDSKEEAENKKAAVIDKLLSLGLEEG